MKNVPKLRFKEFTEEWEEKRFDKVFSFLQNNTFSRDCLTNEKQEVQNIHYGDILVKYHNILDITDNISYIKKENDLKKFSDESYLKTGDIVITDTAEDFTVGKAIEIYNPKQNKILSGLHTFPCRTNFEFVFGYFGQYINSERYHYQLIPLITGIKVSSISKTSIKDTKVKFPCIKEQQKIADFLSCVDTKISLTEEKLENLKIYKKGIMQKIFSPEIRFKDKNGNDYPEWEEKKLGELGKIVTGKTPSTKEKEYWNGDIQFVTPTDMKGGKYQKITERNINESIVNEALPIGTIMFTCIASIGKMSISIKKCITNQQINSIIVNKNFSNEYIYYVLLNIVPKIQASKATTTMPIINKTDFSKILINISLNLEEQQKIADFLSSIDEKIEKTEKKLNELKEFKKGLLQKMFV